MAGDNSQTADTLCWRYPILGLAEYTPSDRPLRFRAKCRTRLDEDIDIVLPDVAALLRDAKKSHRFVHSLVFPPDQAILLNRILSVTPLSMEVRHPSEAIRFHVAFVPLKPVSALTVQLVIEKEGGGARWKYDLELEASPADVDDTILIEAAMQKTESVVFRLTNLFPAPARFSARFTADSPLEFTVVPAHGMLAPAGADGTQFIVSYTANNYGKPVSGLLTIETDEMQWRYEVRGSLPTYVPPQHVRSRIDTRLGSQVETQLIQSRIVGARRNFLRENIEARTITTAASGSRSNVNSAFQTARTGADDASMSDGTLASRGGQRSTRRLLPK
jgi:hypothetical protein